MTGLALGLVPYALLVLILMAALTTQSAIYSLLRWTGGLFVVVGIVGGMAT